MVWNGSEAAIAGACELVTLRIISSFLFSIQHTSIHDQREQRLRTVEGAVHSLTVRHFDIFVRDGGRFLPEYRFLHQSLV